MTWCSSMWHHCNLLDHSKPGVCVTETISSVPLIFPFFKIIKQWSFIEYHGYIWQVSWKVSCGDPWNIRPSAVIARSYITSYYLHHWVIETDYGSESGPWFNKKILSYQYRKSHCGDKTILRPSYLHNGISYTGKTTSLYWTGALDPQKTPHTSP